MDVGREDNNRKLALARHVEKRWLAMLATGLNDAARGLGPVVEALYYGNGEEALIRCREGKVSKDVTRDILKVYGISPENF